MNESEQAQAIAEIRERVKLARSVYKSAPINEILDDCEKSLKIVDSQAQKIAELSALFQKAGNGAVDLAMKCAEQAKELAEARAIAEKMRDRSERPGGGHAFLPWEKQ